MTDTDPPVWLGTQQAADYLGITTRTLYRLIDAGQVPAYKFGRVIRLKQADIDAFIAASRLSPGSLKHLYPDPQESAASSASDEERQQDDEDEH